MPAVVVALAAGREIRAVWQNQLGGITFAVGDELYVKWQDHDVPIDLADEAERLAWLSSYVTVPTVVDRGRDDAGCWLVSAALAGRTSIDDRWIADPEPAVRAIGIGLRRFHDAVPVRSCPFDWTVETRIADAERRFASGELASLRRLPEAYAGLDLGAALDVICDPPPVDHVVVCHGDACAPNTLVDDDGRFVAHVDLGQAGIADRWADLAVASWSLEWNFGPGWDDVFFEAYGVAPDPERIAYYRLLWEC